MGLLIRRLLDKYFTLGSSDFENLELEALLNLKHGYVRRSIQLLLRILGAESEI